MRCILDSLLYGGAGYVEVPICESTVGERALYLYSDGDGGVLMVYRSWNDTIDGLTHTDTVQGCLSSAIVIEETISNCPEGSVSSSCLPCMLWLTPLTTFSSSCQEISPEIEC